jgi:hypothetical protein
VAITQVTGWKPIDTLEVLKTFGQLGRVGEREPPSYRRPGILNPRQNEIIDAAQDPQVKLILIEGDRRTGKSTAAWVAINELMFAGWRDWGLWGAKRDSASKILRDLTADRITYTELNPLIANITAMRLQRVDGCTLNAHASTVADSKGFDYDGVWIEEFDQLLRDNPAVFGAIIPILRAKPKLKIIMTANRDTGSYKLMREYLSSEVNPVFAESVRFYTLTRDEASHLADAENDPLIEPLMEVAVGRDKTQEQLHNVESYSGEVFDAQALVDALNSYDEWMLDMGLVDASLQRTGIRPLRTVIGVDPGFADATAITVESQYRDHVYEEESHEFHGRNERGTEVSQEHIIQFIRALAVKYGAEICIESNSGGLWWAKALRAQGLRVTMSNFTTPGTGTDRESHIRLLNQLLESGRYHYRNERFRAQAVVYSLAEKGKRSNADHGDLVDAKLHAIRRLLVKTETKRSIVRAA